MIVAIMQPYFFPYLGYFCMLKHAERFIVFDTPQYEKQGWMNRNRILHPVAGWQYIIVPTQSHPQKVPLNEVLINSHQDWRQTILSQLGHYRHIAPYYRETRAFVQSLLAPTYQRLVDLNVHTLQETCNYLGLTTRLEMLSELHLSIAPVNECDEWALHICQALGNVSEYINPPGGADFYDRRKYEQAGLGLRFEKILEERYDQKRSSFEPDLSIIDVLMFNKPECVLGMLDHCACI